jgi:hypothetical protein
MKFSFGRERLSEKGEGKEGRERGEEELQIRPDEQGGIGRTQGMGWEEPPSPPVATCDVPSRAQPLQKKSKCTTGEGEECGGRSAI